MIVTALAMGAAAATKKVGGQVAEDAYGALKRLIADRYKRSGALAALDEDPFSETQKKALEEALAKTDASKDAEVIQKAKDLAQALHKLPRAQLEAVGVRIGELEAINARFGEIEVTGGTGLDIGKARLDGDLNVNKITVKSPN